MMKNLVFVLASFCSIHLSAMQADTTAKDTSHWKHGGVVGFNFTQATFTNWAAGGVNTVSGQAYFNAFLNYKRDHTTLDNTLDMTYGLLQQGKSAMVRKTDDRFEITSKYGRYAFKKVWYYSALLSFKTQFQPGYNYVNDTTRTLISDLMSPAYAMLAIGLDYKPNDKFSVFTAPVTARYLLVMNQDLADAGAFGVDKAVYDASGNVVTPGKNLRMEYGGYFRAQYRADVMKNVNLNAKLELFSNYLDRPQNIDVNAEILLTMKVNKYISANVNLQAIYDNDVNVSVDKNNDGVIDGVGPRLQFRQVLGIGFSAKF
jgi:hypothetical protein